MLAKYRMQEMISKDLTLVTLDIRNAFNACPHSLIEQVLNKAGNSQALTKYLMAFLKKRFCVLPVNMDNAVREVQRGPNFDASVPQGDPVAGILFAACIQPAIDKLAEKYEVVAYADDIVLGCPQDCDVQQIISEAEQELAKYGFQLSPNKCRSTANNGEIEFLCQTYSSQDKWRPLSEKVGPTLESCLSVLRWATMVPAWARYQMLRTSSSRRSTTRHSSTCARTPSLDTRRSTRRSSNS